MPPANLRRKPSSSISISISRRPMGLKLDIPRRWIATFLGVVTLLLMGQAQGHEVQAASPAGHPRKVILLTSVDGIAMAQATPGVLFWLRSYYRSLDDRMDQLVRDHFKGSSFEVE